MPQVLGGLAVPGGAKDRLLTGGLPAILLDREDLTWNIFGRTPGRHFPSLLTDRGALHTARIDRRRPFPMNRTARRPIPRTNTC